MCVDVFYDVRLASVYGCVCVRLYSMMCVLSCVLYSMMSCIIWYYTHTVHVVF